MNSWMLRLKVVLLALSLSACQEKLCKAGDERCEIGQGKCVVGYDGDCYQGQVCYAGQAAPKGKKGSCSDGQFDEDGQLIATVVVEEFMQGDQNLIWWGLNSNRDCFFGCPVPTTVVYPPPWLGKAPATLKAIVQGPHAETEQLKIAVREEEHSLCEKLDSTPEGRQRWQCDFLEENWAGENVRTSFDDIKISLWTENTLKYPQIARFPVDTRPLELYLEAQVEADPQNEQEYYLVVQAHKVGLNVGEETRFGAHLKKVEYSSLEVFRENGELFWRTSEPMLCNEYSWGVSSNCSSAWSPRFSSKPSGHFTIRATELKASDWAGNEVSYNLYEKETELGP